MLEDAVALHRAGQLEPAADAYRAVLESQPDHVDAWQLLGLVLHRLGQHEVALDALDRALRLDGAHAPALANRGLVLRALGRPEEAEASLVSAARCRPGFREALLNLARLRAATGRVDEALQAAEQAGSHHPDDPETLQVLGLLRARTGDLAGAVDAWGVALRHRPDPGLAMGLGQALLQLGRPEQAVAPLAFAVVHDAPAAPLFADAVLQSRQLPSGLQPALQRALDSDRVDHQRLERALHHLLSPLDDEALLAHPLLLGWLGRCLVSHPDDLLRLPRLLQRLLDDARAGRPVDLRLVCAFAHQAWWTEHAAPLDADLSAVADPDLRRAFAACARPMSGERPADGPLAELYDATVGATAVEARLGAGLPSLGHSDDAVSAEVAAMYEANPYPRRVGVHRPAPVPLDHTLATVGLRAPPRRPLSVLVAGGGTGQHPLQTATRYAEVSVLAIDLSRASLGRAARVARSHGIDDVRFAQADLLALGGLDERFDVIESVGVLHHLGEPLAGWRVLRGLLADDGVMRIGLYAERGRADVVAARALVAEWGLPPTPEGLREARRRFLTLPAEHPARPITRSPDFPSLSGLRDLVFHVCEHRYTLPRLAAELDELGLTFAGFQHTLPEAAHRYRERWPDDPAQCDLARWDALEAEHPHLFRGMYVFWCAPTP